MTREELNAAVETKIAQIRALRQQETTLMAELKPLTTEQERLHLEDVDKVKQSSGALRLTPAGVVSAEAYGKLGG